MPPSSAFVKARDPQKRDERHGEACPAIFVLKMHLPDPKWPDCERPCIHATTTGHSRPPAQVLGKVDKLRKIRDLLLEKPRVAAGLDV
jgi:hypothetical protein